MISYYQCECQRFFPLQYLYYCQDCHAPKCNLCITQEIDCFFCPSCLDNMTTYDSIMFKNRCKKCFECPSCFSLLSFSQKLDGDKRTIYFSCNFCRWDSITTLDLKSETLNNLVMNCIKNDRNSNQQIKVNSNVETFKKEVRDFRLQMKSKKKKNTVDIDLDSNSDQDESRIEKRGKSITEFMAQRGELETNNNNNNDNSTESNPNSKPIINRICDDSKFDEVPSFESLSNPDQISSWKQRLFNINNNINNFWDLSSDSSSSSLPTELSKVSAILPQRKQLVTRRSKRCSKCDKLLIKPDLIPAKIEFKRQHLGLFYMPKIMLWQEGEEWELKMWNPLSVLMVVRIKIAEIGYEEESFIGVMDEGDPVWQSEEYKGLKEKDGERILERNLNMVRVRVEGIKGKEKEIGKMEVGVEMSYKLKDGEQKCGFVVKFFEES
eukprot:TRINITY_DN7177_c0_g1_i1.p1 TRINITY_DN7177_c0_g1~~TRINITY_DN7177_c0_g1_i1.p1  ORF type:complete len:451 (-),score=110.68 TRINITY_DN7177_c0_g1_i1:38-1348(-)